MRVTIHVDNDWKVSFASEQFGDKTYQRALQKASDGRKGFFPLPPQNELLAENEEHFKLCSGDTDAFWKDYDSITNRSLKSGTTMRFGRYLFGTLIGEAIWANILKHADDSQNRFIELCLSWDSNNAYLHRLNWEMMYGPDGFLFLDRTKKIAISRMAPGTKNIIPKGAGVPPKVLFVIGTSLNDTQIRAGAEYVGLLRQLEKRNRRIHSRVLQKASPQRLIETIQTFQPDVVHFICHGGFNTTEGHGYLELELDERESNRQRYAGQLFTFLSSAAQPPSIVVLSACSTATFGPVHILGAHELAPLAADLVMAGIPIVIGMGGEISDVACRLFTRRFGESLVLGEPLVMATTEGRRAAFAEGVAPYSSADWAFPAVFLSEGVASDFTPITTNEQSPGTIVEDWIERYQLKAKPVFCSREDFQDEYYKLFNSEGNSVLVAYVDEKAPGYGRTRLLQHLAINALRDGHVPCFIGSPAPDWPAPTTTAKLSIEIIKAIGKVRKALQLEPALNSVLMRVLKSRSASAELQTIERDYEALPQICFEELLAYFSNREFDVAANAIKEAIQVDLAYLIADAHKRYPKIIKADSRPVLLLDEVHRYDKAIDPLFNELLPLFHENAGGPSTEQVPTVMTLSLATPADEQLRPIKEKAASRSWIKFKQLKKFDEGEDMLAYAQILLHPFADNLYRGISDKSWAFNYRVDPEIVHRYEQRLRARLKGIPAVFFEKLFFAIVESAVDDHFVIAADDETVLANERNRQ